MIAVAKMRAQTRVIVKVCADKSRQELVEREMMTFLKAPFSQETGMGGAKGQPSISGECQGLGGRG
jgi:hypothetical protein